MTESSRVAVAGAGGHAKVVVATLRAAGMEPALVFDDDRRTWGSEILGIPVKGSTRDAGNDVYHGVVAVGSNRSRKELAARVTMRWITAIHPEACVHPSVRLGVGTVVFAGAIIQPETVIGDHVIINTGAKIDHDCRIGDFAHVAPGVSLAGGVTVGEGALLGIGGSVIPGIAIGAWAVVGAGAVVVRDLADGVTAVGVPARPIGHRGPGPEAGVR